MSQLDKHVLREFVKTVIDLDINLNSPFSTKNYDYEIVTYIDEVQVLDTDENVVISVFKNEVKNE
jgi:hypothetical protein